jgi:hypothetical protein
MIVPVLLAGLALILAYIGTRRQLSRMQLLFVILFFTAGATGVVSQDLTMRLAALLGVGRGADLLLYFAVLLGVLVSANFYFRFRENDRILNELVRRVALLEPHYPPSRDQ